MHFMQSVPPSVLSADRLIARLAARQYGLITLRQLIELGFGRGAIAHRIRLGRLIPIHTGVYAVGHRRTEPNVIAAAAVLAGGAQATLSHFSAAFLWGVCRRWQAPPEIIVPVRRRPAGVRVHVCTTLTRRDVRRHLGIRVTSPARTLLDIAPALPDTRLTRAVNDARLNRHMRLAELAELLERLPRHPGTCRLRPLTQTESGPTRSEFEDRFVAVVHQYGLPEPLLNTYVAGWLVDALFPEQRLIVELDGYEYHGDRGSFERDRERDAATLAAGCATVRVTWERLTRATAREVARLQAILRTR